MDAIEQAETHRKHLLLLLEGIQPTERLVTEKHGAGLLKFLNATRARISTIEQRMQLRKKLLLPRSVAALRLLAQGGYRNASGIKSMIRDVVGYG